MKKNLILFLFIAFATPAISQNLHIGVFGGVSAYNGDLTEKIFPKHLTNAVIGITGNYEINDQIMVRAGLSYTIVGGADRYMEQADLKLRNLSFETKIIEFSAVGEYYLLNLYNRKYSPYFFAGVAVYKFDPYTYNGREKVFLKPLSTEGQGISGYGKEYGLTQFALPVGMGVKFAINDNLRIGLEGGLRKLFTDFLDDVSGNYADPNDLLSARGQLSVDLSYRSDELVGGSPLYPTKGAQRGSPKANDYYYFTGLHLTYRIGGNGNGGSGGNKGGIGCPANVY
jgi:hypothetical protein